MKSYINTPIVQMKDYFRNLDRKVKEEAEAHRRARKEHHRADLGDDEPATTGKGTTAQV